MSTWTSDELDKLGAAEELQIASVGRDGTLRRQVTIWVVRHGDDLYVRSVNGRTSSWFRGAQTRHEAHTHAGGVDKDVLLVGTDDIKDEIDAAYRAKYHRYAKSIVSSIVSPQARAATLKLVPRPANSKTATTENDMETTRNSVETTAGPSEWFTGSVYVDTVATASEQSRVQASSVHFTTGARTAWHTHPNGQTIYVTEGIGLAHCRGGPIEVIRPGDRVFFEPGEEHWHGAGPNRFMTHLAMVEVDDEGNSATWGEHVTDEEYNAAPAS